MSNYKCTFCGDTFALHLPTYTEYTPYFNSSNADVKPINLEQIKVEFFKCPTCNEISVEIDGCGSNYNNERFYIRPKSRALTFPDYIPVTIINDYQEACAIAYLSPKSSATLSRRALQGMIRDFFGIKNKRTLHHEIEAIKVNISDTEFNGLMSLKSIGNIGAHPDKNEDINLLLEISEGEALTLINLIEHFIRKWYISRHEVESLFDAVDRISESKPLPTK